MSRPVVPSILLVGLGNPDCGDDGVGPLVARRVALDPPDGLRAIAHGGDVLSLLDIWDGHDTVILVDAALCVSAPGTIHVIDAARDALPAFATPASSHAFGLAEVLALARELGRLPAQLRLYAVEGRRFAPGDRMSPEVFAAASAVIAQIYESVHCPSMRRGPVPSPCSTSGSSAAGRS